MNDTTTGKNQQMVGTVIHVGEAEGFGRNGIKRLVVIQTPERERPQDVGFWFFSKATARLDGYERGDKVKISYDVNGRGIKGYVTLKGWRIERVGEDREVKPPSTPEEPPEFRDDAAREAATMPDDDMPF